MPSSELPRWVFEFTPFSSMHALSVLWVLASVAAACGLGRWLLASGRAAREETLAVAWAGFVVAVNLFRWIFYRLPGRFEWATSLPIHPCDVGCLIAPLVFLTGWRWARALLFFWGLPFSLLALVFPMTLAEGPGGGDYYLYWLGHQAIFGSAVYDLAVRGYRPIRSDLVFTIAFGTVYFLAILAVNAVLQANYAYVGPRVLGGTPIAWFGPWPARPFLLWGTTVGTWALLYLALRPPAARDVASP